MERQFLPSAAELTNGFPCRKFYETIRIRCKVLRQASTSVGKPAHIRCGVYACLSFYQHRGFSLKSAEVKEWLSYLAPVALPLLVMMRDMIGLKSLNDVGEEKGKKKNP